MAQHQVFEALVEFLPDLVGHDRVEGRARDLQSQIPFAGVAGIDDGTGAILAPDQKAGHVLDGVLGSGQADAAQRSLNKILQSL